MCVRERERERSGQTRREGGRKNKEMCVAVRANRFHVVVASEACS